MEEDDSTNINIDPEVPDHEETSIVASPNVDSNLQDVLTFPLAFTNSAYHEVQLLKLLHDIGAPNYSFKSFMDWGRNCSHQGYNFQPNPQRYESNL